MLSTMSTLCRSPWEAFEDQVDKKNSDKELKQEDEPRSTTSKESAWARYDPSSKQSHCWPQLATDPVRPDFFLQSSAKVLTNALCAVIENPGDFEVHRNLACCFLIFCIHLRIAVAPNCTRPGFLYSQGPGWALDVTTKRTDLSFCGRTRLERVSLAP